MVDTSSMKRELIPSQLFVVIRGKYITQDKRISTTKHKVHLIISWFIESLDERV
jgi:hypothetical protein